MVVDPDPISERQRTVDDSDLKMLGSDDDEEDLETVAVIDEELTERFNL